MQRTLFLYHKKVVSGYYSYVKNIIIVSYLILLLISCY